MGSGQDFVAPLSDEAIRNYHERAKIPPLVSQGIQDHQCLDCLAKPDLIGQKVPDPHVGEHAKGIRDLMRVQKGGNARRGGERSPYTFELPP